MDEINIKSIKYYNKIKQLNSFNKLRYLYKLHITQFFNNNIKYLQDIGYNSKKNNGIGLLIINITKINPQKVDCIFYPLDKIPDELINIKNKIINDNYKDNNIYYYIINRKTTMFLTQSL